MTRSLVASLAIALAAPALSAEPVALRALFPSEAKIYADGPGLARLDLPDEVVARCSPGLANLRVFDPEGHEVPFLIDVPRESKVFESERVGARILEMRRQETAPERGPSVRREIYELGGPDRAPRLGTWKLVVDVARPDFTARVKVSWTGGSADGTIFSVARPRAASKSAIPLAAVALPKVAVEIEHEESGWLAPGFRFESSETVERKGATTVPLTIAATHRDGKSTVIELVRPRGIVPAALRLAAETPIFDRSLTVDDEGPGRAEEPLARGELFRFAGEGIQELDLPMRPARGDRLRVTIDDGDSPPLDGLAFAAVFDRPSIVIPLSGTGGDVPAGVLCFGGNRATVPRYDFARFVPPEAQEVYGKRAEALIRLYDPAAIRQARLGPVTPNAAFDATPALAFAMRPSAAIDTRAFAWRRPLRVESSPEGLARLRLTPEDLAGMRDDLADLRIVDAGSRQWPYLLEKDEAPVDRPLEIASTSKDRTTRYRLTSATEPLTMSAVVVDAPVAFFDRAFRLVGTDEEKHEVPLVAGRLSRRAGDPAPLVLEFGPKRLVRLDLTVEDGDDAPLALTKALARCPVSSVYLAAPAASYALVFGAPDQTTPRYEIERVRDVVLAVDAGPIGAQPIEKNPDYRLSARLTHGGGLSQTLVWGALIAAVVVLGALTLRLARQR